MDETTQEQLIEKLSGIAWSKNLLPFQLRGWVNSLGLHVQEQQAGPWTRLRAGGSIRSYIDAWKEGEGGWEIKRFDSSTWERRFSHLVEPTGEVVGFLENKEIQGQLDTDAELMLKTVIEHYTNTGEWLGLPYYGSGVSEEEKWQRWREEVNEKLQKLIQEDQAEMRKKRLQSISDYESRVRANPDDRFAWVSLAMDYELERRFKDEETALLNSDDPRHLGMFYLATLSTSVRGRGVPTWFYSPTEIPSESLGYTLEKLRSLAIENLAKAQKAYSDDHPFSMDIKLALRATDQLSLSAFDKYDAWKAKKQEEDRQRLA